MRYIDVKISSDTDNIWDAIENEIKGIKGNVSMIMADEVLRRAKYYCPVDTGNLVNSGTIIYNNDGSCDVVFDCEYAWYVHENMIAKHEYPKTAKFLSIAIQEVEELWSGE